MINQEGKPEYYSHFFELSIDLLCVANLDGYFIDINLAWETTLGYKKEELLDRPFLDYVHPDDIQNTFSELEALNSGKKVFQFENRYRAANGDWVWLSWNAMPQDDGTIYAIARNISAQKANELETAKLLEQLQASNRELDQFAYIVSHDLKSPLRGINSLAEWIEEDLGPMPPKEIGDHLQMLKQRVNLMQRLINDLLVFARTGRQAENASLLDINEIINEVLGSTTIPEDFNIQIQQKLPAIVGVKTEFFQVFFNLLGNAIKYRRIGPASLSIGAKSSKDSIRYWVIDDGIGIDARYFDKIFQVFQRLNGSKDIEGTGIGLAIVKKIVEAHGGKIEVSSELGKWTKFEMIFPKARGKHT